MEPRKAVEPTIPELELGDFSLTELGSKANSPNFVILWSLSFTECAACSLDAAGQEFNPFLTHGFLSSLEESGCAVKAASWSLLPALLNEVEIVYINFQETGWVPQHIVARVLGVIPLYLKSHSYGEYVFDHGQMPITATVTGPRILVCNTQYRDEVFDILGSALVALTIKFQVSSLHITFSSANDWEKLKERGFLQRIGMQYHWKNRNYKRQISVQNLAMKRLRGYEIKAKHWDNFYKFYKNTTDNKWGSAYLTRDFFHNMASKMGDQVLLIAAEEEGELVAGALNLIRGDTLYGRLWGSLSYSYYPSLHFEACYYQPIEAVIELNLNKVEAGAQGEHKIQRGYLPVTTYSCHYIVFQDFRNVISNFLERERANVYSSFFIKIRCE